LNARERLEQICRALPDVDAESGQHIGFSVRGRRFAWLVDDHHGDGRLALHCKAPPGQNEALAAADSRLFVPPYLGPRGWIGAWLDLPDVDWDRVEQLVGDSYRMTAPKVLAARRPPA
jgi:hypothetical protein